MCLIVLDYICLTILDTRARAHVAYATISSVRPCALKGGFSFTMDENRLGLMEGRFADIIWQSAPISTGDLVKVCETQFGWKRTTTYTMLKRLCQRGIFENDSGTVIVLMPKEKFHQRQSEQFVSDTFGGSLPAFIATFTKGKTLSDEDADEIQRLIDRSRSKNRHKNKEESQ